MKITVLTENTTKKGLPVEHGLSLFIESEGRKILFDTGQSALFAENAERLGIDLSEAELAVISHGHYDHGGGLKAFLSINKTAPVYLSRYAFEEHFNAEGKYIGLDPSLQKSDRLIFTGDEHKLCDGMTLYSRNGSGKRLEMGAFGLGMKKDGAIVPDDFRHEHYLLIEEAGKRILISGCSHKGIINIAEWFKPDILVGGFHFMKLEPSELLRSYAETLDAFDIAYYTCHCTGTAQYEFMKPHIKNLNYIAAGDTVIL